MLSVNFRSDRRAICPLTLSLYSDRSTLVCIYIYIYICFFLFFFFLFYFYFIFLFFGFWYIIQAVRSAIEESVESCIQADDAASYEDGWGPEDEEWG